MRLTLRHLSPNGITQQLATLLFPLLFLFLSLLPCLLLRLHLLFPLNDRFSGPSAENETNGQRILHIWKVVSRTSERMSVDRPVSEAALLPRIPPLSRSRIRSARRQLQVSALRKGIGRSQSISHLLIACSHWWLAQTGASWDKLWLDVCRFFLVTLLFITRLWCAARRVSRCIRQEAGTLMH